MVGSGKGDDMNLYKDFLDFMKGQAATTCFSARDVLHAAKMAVMDFEESLQPKSKLSRLSINAILKNMAQFNHDPINRNTNPEDESMNYSKSFRERLVEARRLKRMSHADLAERTGIHPSLICNLEGGRHLPMFRTIIKLAEVLDVSMDWLVGRRSVGIVAASVRTYADDWPKIRKLEAELLKNHE